MVDDQGTLWPPDEIPEIPELDIHGRRVPPTTEQDYLQRRLDDAPSAERKQDDEHPGN